jgi:hypothetical protein
MVFLVHLGEETIRGKPPETSPLSRGKEDWGHWQFKKTFCIFYSEFVRLSLRGKAEAAGGSKSYSGTHDMSLWASREAKAAGGDRGEGGFLSLRLDVAWACPHGSSSSRVAGNLLSSRECRQRWRGKGEKRWR